MFAYLALFSFNMPSLVRIYWTWGRRMTGNLIKNGYKM